MSINYLALRSSPLSTITAGVVNYSTITGSTLRGNTNTVKTVAVVQPASGPTSNKICITNLNNTYIRTSDIKSELDGPVDTQQIVTFGPSIQTRVLSAGANGNPLAYSSDGITWYGSGNGTAIFTSNVVSRIAATNGIIWVSGGPGSSPSLPLIYSYDAITWNVAPNGTNIFTTNTFCGAWGGNKFVVGGNGTNGLAYSYDGINWTGLGTTIFTYGYGLAYNGSKWVAVGSGGASSVAWSNDGITWYPSASGNVIVSGPTNGSGVAWNGVRWVICSTGTNAFAYSSDGNTWYPAATSAGAGTSIFTNGYAVAWNGVIFVACGSGNNKLAYSTDGITWTGSTSGNATFTTEARAVVWTGTRWVASGDANNILGYSPDGITWTGSASGNAVTTGYGWGMAVNTKRPNSIAFPQNLLVACGSGQNALSYSSDGVNWTAVTGSTSIFSTAGRNAAWNGYNWVAVGQGTANTIAISTDGITWSGLGSAIFTTAGYGVTWNGSRWIAVGAGTNNSIAYSNDGYTWIGLGTSVFSTGYAVAWNGTRFVAGGTAKIAYSADGLTWTTGSTAIFTGTCYAVAWNGSRFVAGGTGTNSLAWSTDGITWNGLGTAVFSSTVYGVAWNGTRFVAVGAGTANTIAYSADGITWTGVGSSIFTGAGYGISWNNKQWLVTGNSSGSTSVSATSADGITWTTSLTSYAPYVYFPFENSTADALGNSTITPTGSITYVTGRIGTYAAYFANSVTNGTVYIKGTWPSTTNFTISGWFYTLSSTTTNGQQQPIFEAYGANNFNIFINGTGSAMNLAVAYPNGTGFAGPITSTNAVVANTWNSFVFVYQSGGTCTLYLNGVFGASGTSTAWTGSANTGFTIATYNNGTGAAFNGYLDDFRIYNYAMPLPGAAAYLPGTLTTNIYNVGWNGNLGTGPTPNVFIQHPTIACGTGTNSLAYSPDGIQWTGLGTTVFTTAQGVAWNGLMWVAGGSGANTVGYSYDGVAWTGLGSTIFGASGYAVAWNGLMWIAVGQCVTNTINYSYDGITWTGLGTSTFGTAGRAVGWNGVQWVAGGYNATAGILATSTNGLVWTPSANGSAIFSVQVNGLVWGGNIWVACGQGTNTLAYSLNGSTWTAGTGTLFSTAGYGVTWNGTRFVAVGTGGYTILTSTDGKAWSNVTTGTSLFTTAYSVCWNQTRFVATGSGPQFVYSNDGLNWYAVAPSWGGTTATPYVSLPFENSATDTQSHSTLTTTGSISYVTGQVGTYAANFVNTPILPTLATGGWATQNITNTLVTNSFSWTWTAPVACYIQCVQFYAGTGNNGVNWNMSVNGTNVGASWYFGAYGLWTMPTSGNAIVNGNVTISPSPVAGMASILCPAGNTVVFGGSSLSGSNTIRYGKDNVSGTCGVNIFYIPATFPVANTSVPTSGTNYLRGTIPTLTNFIVSGAFNAQSLSADATSFVYNPQVIFSMYGGSIVVTITSNNTITCSIPSGGTTNTITLGTTVAAINQGVWYNFTIIFQAGGVCSFYINNALIGYATNSSGTGTYTTTTYALGTYDNTAYLPFTGYIDNVQIYNSTTQTNVVYGVASNPRIGATLVDSQLTLGQTSYSNSNKLDIVSDQYFQNGFTEFSANVTVRNTF